MRYPLTAAVVGWATLVAAADVAAKDPLLGYNQRVTVTAPTRLDWSFVQVVDGRDQPAGSGLGAYDSTKQQYELYVPPDYDTKKAYPVILFLSPSEKPTGWAQWEKPCKDLGIIYACPYAAGNNALPSRRVRIALDVLDELRRNYHTDVQRTYLAGFSGGARMACIIAYGLPEYFGGLIAIGGGSSPRPEAWLRRRVIEGLPVALVTGENDFNRPEMERQRALLLKDIGVEYRIWTFPNTGHAVPSGPQLSEIVQWLEQGAEKRRESGNSFPAMKVAGDAMPRRAEQSQALLEEAKARLRSPALVYSGMLLLKGLAQRWHDQPAAVEAFKLIAQLESRRDRPWELEGVREERRYLLARARAEDAFATGPLPPVYERGRGGFAKTALQFWQQFARSEGPNTPEGQEAAQRIVELQRLVNSRGGL